MSRTKQNSIAPLAIGIRLAVWMGLLLALIAAPAQANRIVEVRVGNHPTFTRLVFEMDAFSGYQVERRSGADGSEQLTVTLEATTPTREITSKSVGIESINIAESLDHAVAQIRLRKPGLQMKEMILSNPPRIVLDFVHSAAAIAELTADPYAKPAPAEPKPVVAKVAEPKPEPKPAVAAKPAPEPVVAKVAEPKPEPKPAVAPKPAPEPVVAKVAEPKPAPKPAVAAKPAPEPVIAKVAEPKPKPVAAPVAPADLAEEIEAVDPEPAIAKVVEPNPQPVATPVAPAALAEEIGIIDPEPGAEATASSLAAEAARRAAIRDAIPGVHKRGDLEPPSDPTSEWDPSDPSAEATPEQIADAADAIQDAPQDSSSRVLTPPSDDAQQRVPSPSDINRRGDQPKPANSGLPFNMITLAGIAAGVLVVVFVTVRLFRRRSLPQDLDVTALADAFDDDAEASDSEASDQIASERFTLNDSPSDDYAPQVEEQNTAAYSLSEVAANANEPETGLYNEDSEGEKPMDMETTRDLPTERDDFAMPPVTAMSGGDSDISQLVQELASRIATLETRLDEANDSRERLERQVAAQSEELRVQRAAIARTQRALRSLSRSEEEQATEPALRQPSQPAK